MYSWEINCAIWLPLVILDNIKRPDIDSDLLTPEVLELLHVGKLEREKSYQTLKAWEKALQKLGKSLSQFKPPDGYCLRAVQEGEVRLKEPKQRMVSSLACCKTGC